MWHRYISEAPLANPVSNFSNETQELFSTLQWIIANSMTTDHEVSVPSLTLSIKDKNSILLSYVHDISDWVITFDKNMGPEFYDIPCKEGETPYSFRLSSRCRIKRYIIIPDLQTDIRNRRIISTSF